MESSPSSSSLNNNNSNSQSPSQSRRCLVDLQFFKDRVRDFPEPVRRRMIEVFVRTAAVYRGQFDGVGEYALSHDEFCSVCYEQLEQAVMARDDAEKKDMQS